MKNILIAFTLSVISASAQAIPILWDISFQDNNNILVGQGVFSFDTDTETEILAGPFSQPEITVSTAITGLNWNIQGQIWDETDASVLWWADTLGETHPPGHLGRQRGPSFVVEDRWFLGDPFLGTKQLSLNFETADSNSGSGSWGQAVVPGFAPNPGPLFGSGKWSAVSRATVVPIPGTIPLFAIGLAGLFYFGRNTHSKKNTLQTNPVDTYAHHNK